MEQFRQAKDARKRELTAEDARHDDPAPLYELTRYQSELERLADSGEVPPEEIADTLQALEGDIKEKAVQVAALTRNLDSAAEAIREAGLAMIARAERLERRADGIRNYLLFHLQVAGITKIEAPWFVVSVRKNPPSVVIEDEIQIPAEFMVQPPPPPPRPDKVAIGAKLKAGETVRGRAADADGELEIGNDGLRRLQRIDRYDRHGDEDAGTGAKAGGLFAAADHRPIGNRRDGAGGTGRCVNDRPCEQCLQIHMTSLVVPSLTCPASHLEGTVPIATHPDPKRLRGWIWRNRPSDAIGCLKCDRWYPWSGTPEQRSGAT